MQSKTNKVQQKINSSFDYTLKFITPASNYFSITEPHIKVGLMAAGISATTDETDEFIWPQFQQHRIISSFAPSQYSREEAMLCELWYAWGFLGIAGFKIDDRMWRPATNYILFGHGQTNNDRELMVQTPGSYPELSCLGMVIDDLGQYFHSLVILTKKDS